MRAGEVVVVVVVVVVAAVWQWWYAGLGEEELQSK